MRTIGEPKQHIKIWLNLTLKNKLSEPTHKTKNWNINEVLTYTKINLTKWTHTENRILKHKLNSNLDKK